MIEASPQCLFPTEDSIIRGSGPKQNPRRRCAPQPTSRRRAWPARWNRRHDRHRSRFSYTAQKKTAAPPRFRFGDRRYARRADFTRWDARPGGRRRDHDLRPGRLWCKAPALRLRIGDRKGFVQAGGDLDIMILDPRRQSGVCNADRTSKMAMTTAARREASWCRTEQSARACRRQDSAG
jgi:hypothetical protein